MIAHSRRSIMTWQNIKIVWTRNFLVFKKSWTVSAFWILLEPVFVLSGLGYGLGSFINNIEGRPYVDFFFPALLCNSAMMVAYFTSTYDNFSKLTYQRLYVTQIMTPLNPIEIGLGEILWGATKGTVSALGIALVGALLGLVETWRIIPALGVVFVLCLFFSALGLVVTTFVKNYDQIIYPTSGLIIPMSLFSGTYFPIEQLPFGLKYVSYVFPLTHAVKIVRGLLLKGTSAIYLVHLLVVIAFVIIFSRWAVRRLNRKLLQ